MLPKYQFSFEENTNYQKSSVMWNYENYIYKKTNKKTHSFDFHLNIISKELSICTRLNVNELCAHASNLSCIDPPGGYSDLVWTGVCHSSLKTLTHV